MHNPLENEKIIRVKNDATVATTDVESDAVDALGWDSVEFVVLHGTITDGTPDCKLQQSDDSDGDPDAFSDLESSLAAVLDADDDKLTRLCVRRPSKRYVRCVVDRAGATGSVVDGIIAILRGPKTAPITQDTTVSSATFVNTPAEGTA